MAASTERRTRTDGMVKELLHLIDLHGVLRKPTWDGVRVLLLVWPLTHGVQTPIQRIVRFLITLALCALIYLPTDNVRIHSFPSLCSM